MAKYINIPFATSGNKTAIPDTTTDGTVNYTDGFGGDYARPLGTDPLAKTVDRETINQALYDYGTAIKQLQENGVFTWQSTKAGGYDVGAIVSLNGVNYENTVAANTATPPNNGWKLLSDADFVRGLPADFTSSKVTNGYQKLPSGLIIQWGIVLDSIGNNGPHTINYPIAFPNDAFMGVAQMISTDVQRDNNSAAWSPVSSSQCKIVKDNNLDTAWIAIGY